MSRNRYSIIPLLLLIVLVSIFTFPLILRPFSYIPGFSSTDESYGALWNFWWLKYAAQNHLSESHCPLIAAPYGISSSGSGYPLWNFINKWLTFATNNVFAYNFEIIFSFVASAVSMYYLTLYLSTDIVCSIFSATLYAFCPYHFARAWQHLGLAQIQWMPLYILALLKLKEKPGVKNVIFTALSLFFVFSFDLYYAYFMLIATVLFIIFSLYFNWRKKAKQPAFKKTFGKFSAALFVTLVLVVLLISPNLFTIFKNKLDYSAKEASAHNPYVRPFDDLFSQSARPLSYFLPTAIHPVFGRITQGFIGSDFYGESLTEHTLYLGWVPLILAFIAFKRRKENKKHSYIGLFTFLALGAWLFSQPPWWDLFGFKLYMPTYFMYKILPMFRAYCRFGIVVMLAVSILAGLGLMFILEKFRSKKKKIAIVSIFFTLVLFEFWNYPPFKVIDVSKTPQVYRWISQQKGNFTIAEYPLDAASPNEIYKFQQTKHEKKIINGTIPATFANSVAKTITKLSNPYTAGVLKWMGVKYVLVHRDAYLKTDLIQDREELNKVPLNQGIKLVKSFQPEKCPKENILCVSSSGTIDVYEVVAPAIKPNEQK